jgi:hypothetical protein
MRSIRPFRRAGSRRPPVLAFVSAVMFAVIGAGPVLADAELGHTGTVGFHELRDGRNGGAICRYKELVPSPGNYQYEAELKWIDVRPPKMKAIAGEQRVGWRFIIERRDYVAPTLGDWTVVYRSSVQKAVTDPTTNASFAMMGSRINVPAEFFDDVPSSGFRLQVKMFWYDVGGSVQSTATHLVERYKRILANDDGTHPTISLDRGGCTGWEAFAI